MWPLVPRNAKNLSRAVKLIFRTWAGNDPTSVCRTTT
jgi:hypothetical protein